MTEAGGSEKNPTRLIWDEVAGHFRPATEAEATEALRRRRAAVHRFQAWWIGEWKILIGVVAVAFALILAVAVALGGGIFAAVPGQGSAANGGVYVINKFTGNTSWCPPGGGGCRSH